MRKGTRIRWGKNRRICGDCMTCTGTSKNGAATGWLHIRVRRKRIRQDPIPAKTENAYAGAETTEAFGTNADRQVVGGGTPTVLSGAASGRYPSKGKWLFHRPGKSKRENRAGKGPDPESERRAEQRKSDTGGEKSNREKRHEALGTMFGLMGVAYD